MQGLDRHRGLFYEIDLPAIPLEVADKALYFCLYPGCLREKEVDLKWGGLGHMDLVAPADIWPWGKGEEFVVGRREFYLKGGVWHAKPYDSEPGLLVQSYLTQPDGFAQHDLGRIVLVTTDIMPAASHARWPSIEISFGLRWYPYYAGRVGQSEGSGSCTVGVFTLPNRMIDELREHLAKIRVEEYMCDISVRIP